MPSRNQQIIRDYFNSTYKDFLVNPYLLTSIVIPDEPTCDIINLIGTFSPEVKKNNITSMPVISINYIDENTICGDYADLKDIYLKEVKNIITKIIEKSSIFYSLSLDYRLLNDDILKLLKKKYNESRFTLRIIGENYVISPEDYEKISFIDEIIVNKASENIVELKESDLIINNNLVIDNIIPNKGYDPINEFYITKELTKEEYSLVIDKINNTISRVKKLFIRVYKPENYKSIMDNILKNNLEDTVEINFLSNPLEDKTEHFEYLRKFPNKVTITYTTNKSRLNKLTKEPYSDNAHYPEELECNGKLGLNDYLNILYSIDFLQRKSTILELSPLEKLIYVYRYIEKNSSFLNRNEINHEKTYFNRYGYAKLFSIFLRRLSIPCFIYTTSTRLKNISYIIDKKYKIERILVTDITADVETNRFKLYNIYSFSYFGLSPIDTLKSKEVDYITVPASLVLSAKSFEEYVSSSYNEVIKNTNLTKNVYDFSLNFLNLCGFTNLSRKSLKSDYYVLLADLLSKSVMEPLDESILKAGVSCIIEKELNSSRKDQKIFEIEKAVTSNRIGRAELGETPRILLNHNNETLKEVEVTLIESQSKNKEFDTQKTSFTNKVEQIIKEIFEIKQASISNLQNNDYLVEAIINTLIELYNDRVSYPLLIASSRKRIIKTLYNRYERNLYKKVPINLYNYLREEIIPEIELIVNSKELKYLLSCQEDSYNSEDYNRNYFRITTKIKYLIEKLISVSSKEYGISYEYTNYTLIIKVDNPHINDYIIQLVSDNIIALSKKRVSKKKTLSKVKSIDTRKLKDYLEVYLDKLKKHNEYISEANNIISAIEKLDNFINDNSAIDKFIELEREFTKIEKQLFKHKIELSDFRSIFYNRFETSITSYNEVKSFKLNDYTYNKKPDYYLDLFTQVEQSIRDIALSNYQDTQSKEEIDKLLTFLDYIIYYLNHQILSEESLKEDLSEKIRYLYQRKSSILKELSNIDRASKGLNIILNNKKITSKYEEFKIVILDAIIMELDGINHLKLINNLKLRRSNQVLNRFKSSKKRQSVLDI